MDDAMMFNHFPAHKRLPDTLPVYDCVPLPNADPATMPIDIDKVQSMIEWGMPVERAELRLEVYRARAITYCNHCLKRIERFQHFLVCNFSGFAWAYTYCLACGVKGGWRGGTYQEWVFRLVIDDGIARYASVYLSRVESRITRWDKPEGAKYLWQEYLAAGGQLLPPTEEEMAERIRLDNYKDYLSREVFNSRNTSAE